MITLLQHMITGGTTLGVSDDTGRSLMHAVVERNYCLAANLLLTNECSAELPNTVGHLPVEEAIHMQCDEMASLIIRHMSHEK